MIQCLEAKDIVTMLRYTFPMVKVSAWTLVSTWLDRVMRVENYEAVFIIHLNLEQYI